MHNWTSNLQGIRLALSDGNTNWSGQDLIDQVDQVQRLLMQRRQPHGTVALLADNSAQWVATDLACMQAGVALVPLPGFFTPGQWAHSLAQSGASTLVCPSPALAHSLGYTQLLGSIGALQFFDRPTAAATASGVVTPAPDLRGVQKVTFTSGTTAQPKGVCLSAAAQWDVATALLQVLAPLQIERHLCLLPLSVLLENVAGVYTALLSGAYIACPPLHTVGLTGSSQFDAQTCLNAIAQHQAQSIIVLPQMLHALVAACSKQDERVRSLKFVAVGGAKTPVGLIAAARARGIPAYEGYGLSECASVVCLNTPGCDRPGSVGKPLPGRQVCVDDTGEIRVTGQQRSHYLTDTAPPACTPADQAYATGDLGRIDADGFVHLTGRQKNILITAFGRNISPEWPENLLLETGLFAQAVVIGDGQPRLSAVLLPAQAGLTVAQCAQALNRVNAQLPDYARLGDFVLCTEPLSPSNGLATANGRPRRDAIARHFQQTPFTPVQGDDIAFL